LFRFGRFEGLIHSYCICLISHVSHSILYTSSLCHSSNVRSSTQSEKLKACVTESPLKLFAVYTRRATHVVCWRT